MGGETGEMSTETIVIIGFIIVILLCILIGLSFCIHKCMNKCNCNCMHKSYPVLPYSNSK